MKNFLRIALFIAGIFASVHGYTSTMTPKLDFLSGFVYIKLEGKIVQNDPLLLVNALELAKAKNLKVWGVFLSSPGGDVNAGLQLASIIRQNQLSTYVTANTTCSSACFYLFAAGVNRWAENGAKVGVHSAAENGLETDKATAATIHFLRELGTKLNVPDGILGKIAKTPPQDIYILSPQDLASMGVQFVPTPANQIQNILAEAGLKKSVARNTQQDRLRARELNKVGLDALRNDHMDDALASLSEAATLYPFDAEILGNLGYAQYLNGLHEAALGTLLTALKVQPGRAMTLQNIGLVYAELENIEVAAQYLASYVRTFKNSGVAVESLQKWAADDSQPQRAQASARALDIL
jgi:hypothetical protein